MSTDIAIWISHRGGCLAGAELTAGLSRLAGKRSPRGQVATPTDMLLATFCRLFSIFRS